MSTLEVTIPCRQCGSEQSVPLAEVTPGRSRPCTSCGAIFTFAGEDASGVEQVVEELRGRFPGISVEVKVETRRPWWKFWGT